MFDVFCARCRARVLLTSRRIRLLENREDGIVITYRCWCGEPGVWRTGRS